MAYPGNFTTTVYTGDILTVDADAIVTGEGSDLKKESQVTRALLDNLPEFGKKREELKKKCKKSHLKMSSVHVSKMPMGIPFKYILHAVLMECENEKKWLKNMSKLYDNIIKTADDLNIRKLAIPLLGAGVAEAAVTLSIQAATKSLLRACPKCLTNVMLVSQNDQISALIKAQIRENERQCDHPTNKYHWFPKVGTSMSPKDITHGQDHKPSSSQGHHQKQACMREEDLKTALALSVSEATVDVKHSMSEESLPNINSFVMISDHPPFDVEYAAVPVASSGVADASADAAASVAAAYNDDNDDDDDDDADDDVDDQYEKLNKKTFDKSYDPGFPDEIVTCPICLDPVDEPKQLDKCGHIFCKDCIDCSFREFKSACPSCNTTYILS